MVKVQIVNEEEATVDGSGINVDIEKDLLIPERQKSKKKPRLSQAQVAMQEFDNLKDSYQ